MLQIQGEIKQILSKLHQPGFKAFLVGGCVRDLMLGEKPKDWDIATSAKPKQIQKIFPKSFYHNKFGTVTIPSKKFGQIEITTFRKESDYADKRHPSKVVFTTSLEKDLARRDFTINSLAFGPNKAGKWCIIDKFNAYADLKNGLIKTVGDPYKRFSEDALRLLRAVRFSAQLDFKIDLNTQQAIKKRASLLKSVSKERIRDEFIKIIMSNCPKKGISLCKELGLLDYFLPELTQGIGVEQSGHHIYTVFEHGVNSLQYAANKKYTLEVRLSALFHDIAKPEAKEQSEQGKPTFHYHDVLSARQTKKILKRLRFPNKVVDKVFILIRYHMFLSDPDQVTESAARRLIKRVGKENIANLLELRQADRIGSGCPKARPYRLRCFEYLLDKVSRDPIDETMLKINGNDLIKLLDLKPGPKIGLILRALLNEVLDDPQKNNKNYLKKRAQELIKLDNSQLKKLGQEAKEKKQEIEQQEKKKFKI